MTEEVICLYGQRLTSDPPQVRLLTIEPAPQGDDDPVKLTAYRFNLDAAPKYVAVSYVWGDPNVTNRIIFNGKPLNVTANLFAALRALRRRDDIWFIWVDALCINQNDITEKNDQLPLMGHIYNKASIVVSWLGEPSTTTQRAFGFIKDWIKGEEAVRIGSHDSDRLADTINAVQQPFNQLAWEAIHDLLGRAYWRRLWIVQEFYATTAMILCGDLELAGPDMLQAVRIWSSVVSTEFETSSLTTNAEKGLIRSCNLDFFQRTVQERARPLAYKTPYADRPSDIASLIEAMIATSKFETTDPRDKIFALVAFLELSKIPLRQDYSIPLPELYRDLMIYALEDSGLSQLTMIAYAGTGHTSSHQSGLPSWVPDFTGKHPYLQEYSHSDKSMLTYWRTPTPWILKTRGLLLDKIAHISSPDNNDVRRLWRYAVFAASICNNGSGVMGIPWRVALYRTLTRSTFESIEAYHTMFKGEYLNGFNRAMRKAFSKYEITSSFTERTSSNEMDLKLPYDGRTVESVLAIEKEANFWSRDSRTIVEEEFGGYSKGHDETIWGEQFTRSDDHRFWERFNSPVTKKRTFFITETGYMGLGPIGAREGDQVAVLLGCRVPLIVREHDESYELVGDAFVCGLMEGQAVEIIRDESTFLKDIYLR